MKRLSSEPFHELAACLDLQPPMMISLVGAGGKTSAMLTLARDMSSQGHRVLVSTTTKIYRPDLPLLLEADPNGLKDRVTQSLKPGGILALGAELIPAQPLPKLRGLPTASLDMLLKAGAADYILVEADGSRRLPIKAPRRGEPLIPSASGLVLGVVGLSALGKAADGQTVFVLEEFLGITGLKPGEFIDLPSIMKLVEHPQGLFKQCPAGAARVALLNQLDLLPSAKQDNLLAKVMDSDHYKVVVGSLKQNKYYAKK